MRHACISALIAAVLVVTRAGAAQAQNQQDDTRPEFALTPAMAQALTIPAPTLDFRPGAGVLLQASRSARPGRRAARMVASGFAFGFIGMALGHGIGAAVTRNCGCHDPGEAGGFYGMMIGGATGALFGAWVAGR